MKHGSPTPATLRAVYVVRIALWLFTVYLVAGPLRVFKGTGDYLWYAVGVLVAGFVAGLLIGGWLEGVAMRKQLGKDDRPCS